jgi:alkanesulfonate monooxygenase SsuD/methylene tetrahydromethanopterin reductase-like flavin-dependent oxidoreductase (luciferase family)
VSAGAALSYGLYLPASGAAGERLDPWAAVVAAERAEQSGFGGVYVGDHVLHPGQILESIVALSFVAARTTQVTLGTCVLLLALRRPMVIAKQLATLACFAPGRLRIGVGVGGEIPEEWAACDVPTSERAKLTEDAVVTLRAVLAGEALTEPPIRPVPYERVPIRFGGRRDPALRRAARKGDGWIGYLLSPEGFARSRDLLMEERSKLGAQGDFSLSLLLPCAISEPGAGEAEMDAALVEAGKKFSIPPKYVAVGTPEKVAATVERYRRAGCEEIIFSPLGRGEAWDRQFTLLSEEVLPA